ncbi:uncharacterized protein K452DRAFT_287835 [Aplosporella prunicola CBS 121167]|uniref:N-acetyltransferase domain-containing protein n=1 Tax=Aplosporella prunicola CBS 121167 TaxID=1176127 RepID=A0A6A6BCB4_9PEZI|nr:uncharacterized protein K452DRAFT_287835 [Aplosporella prunicola CBS 121167]KAF2141862.1 hypothetical protein K452DRAFT_287835 [Aplosporella prunicola CBS 121167]
MTLVLSPMEQADFPRLTQILHAAYYSTSGISALLYNSPPSAKSLEKLTETRKRIAREDATARFLKITDTDIGEIIACARWHVYEHGRTEEEMDKKTIITDDELIPEFNAPVYKALFEPILRRHKEVMGTRPHIYLATLVTHPDHGRKGAGSVLLQWGLDKADEMGLEAFVEATPMGQGLYEKMGFEVAKDVPFDLGQFGEEGVVHHVCMVRQPKPDPTEGET